MKADKKGNFLDYVPQPARCIRVNRGEDGLNFLEICHDGWADRIIRKFCRKPPVTQIRLEKFGSLIWQLMDGKRSIYEIALVVREVFQEEAEPLFDRLVLYFRILRQKGYITFTS